MSFRFYSNGIRKRLILRFTSLFVTACAMSLVLLISSLVYELTGFAYADVIGAAGLIYFSISEGREAFEKAKGKECTTC